MMRLIYIILGIVPLAATAQDGDLYYPPAGCTGTLTVQSRSCMVSHIYTCAADQPGESWRIQFNADGPNFLSKIDAETQWLESYELFPIRREVLQQPAPDPASLSELLSTGTDAYDFVQRSETGVVRVVGFDRLSGNDVVIDGEPLLGTEFSARYEDTSGTYLEVSGAEFVSVKHRRFVSGLVTQKWTRDGDTIEWDRTPVDFIYPGEPGFFSKTPLYDCEASLASYRPNVKGSDQ
ncbi:hypothetical protein [uncultured Tateyamaria sp.]|uniref:hypothetical protein n=1 Tax=uncultured Tateyamaria sp. TaxID=455651 RepID=UPI002612AB43|nr:hypothetical protein [uncultured Tateyamaria sp.]